MTYCKILFISNVQYRHIYRDRNISGCLGHEGGVGVGSGGGDENVLKLIVVIVYNSVNIPKKPYCIVHFKWVTYILSYISQSSCYLKKYIFKYRLYLETDSKYTKKPSEAI